MTPLWVLSGQGCTITKPVAASTMVQIATLPEEDFGMSTRSKWNLSPNAVALGFKPERGIRVRGLAGFAVWQMSHEEA